MDNYALVNDIASVWKYADEMFPAFGSISIDWDRGVRRVFAACAGS